MAKKISCKPYFYRLIFKNPLYIKRNRHPLIDKWSNNLNNIHVLKVFGDSQEPFFKKVLGTPNNLDCLAIGVMEKNTQSLRFYAKIVLKLSFLHFLCIEKLRKQEFDGGIFYETLENPDVVFNSNSFHDRRFLLKQVIALLF